VTTVPIARADRRRLQVAAIFVVALGVAAAPAQQTTTPAASASGFLMGRVVDAMSGAALAGAEVTLSGGAQSPVRMLTNGDGHYLFRQLSPGRYLIAASTPGYLYGGFGQTRTTGSPQSLDLTNGEQRGGLTIRLWPHSSISGIVTDDDGEPVGACRVRVFQRTYVNGRPMFVPAPQVAGATDDRGVYRLSGLGPGDYLVGVMSTQTTMPASTVDAYLGIISSGNSAGSSALGRELRDSGAPQVAPFRYRVGGFSFQSGPVGEDPDVAPRPDGRIFVYPTVFHPSAATVTEATLVMLPPGTHRTGADIRLRRSPTVRVSGTVTGPDGPVANLGVRLLPAEADEFGPDEGAETASTATDANGVFTFLGVPPGRYVLKALRLPRPETYDQAPVEKITLPSSPTLWATIPMAVGNTDVEEIAVGLLTGSQISGRVVFEGTNNPPAPETIARVSIAVALVSGATSSALRGAYKRVDTMGRFATVGFPPGRYTIGASLPGPAGGTWRFKSATLAGRDLTEEGLLIDGTNVSGVVITFTDKRTEVTGAVTGVKGVSDASASIVVFPADTQGWPPGFVNTRRVRTARVSTNGTFAIQDLPAGNYFIAAVKDDELDDPRDPRVLAALAKIATRFLLRDGEKVIQNVTTRSTR
jgi:hypothetical protein